VKTKQDYDVLVIGAGPVGLMLATELGLAGVRVGVVERLTEVNTAPKAGGINTASAEIFERRGLLPAIKAVQEKLPFQAEKKRAPFAGHFGGIQVPADSVDEQDPLLRGHGSSWFVLVQQVEVERILGERAAELGIEVRRGVEVEGFDADDTGVTVHLGGGDDLRAGWIVGCDGGRSMVRRQAGFDFPGTDPTITFRQATGTVEGVELLSQQGWQHTPTGVYVYGPRPGWIRTVELDGPPADRDAPVTAAEMDASLRRVTGLDVHVTDVVDGGTRFTDNARQATTYRKGRVLLCGDAAHVHSPFSGQGLNLGLGDALNLGWKLAATVQGRAPEDLLDTYTSERHPIGAAVLDWTRAQVAAMRGDAYGTALRSLVTEFLTTRDGATLYAQRVSGLGQRYDLGDGHPLVGSLVPKLWFNDATSLAEHARQGKALLVDLAEDDHLSDLAKAYPDHLEFIRAEADNTGLTGLLIRPDGFVAWASDQGTSDPAGLEAALKRWFA
jgi:2-polyprenyl-6-methoxyphenol hydroxylase-like FAD-dependent oxidoreductase